MKLRIRNAFKHRESSTIEEKANILAYNIWQISLAGAKNLHAEDYLYESDDQRVGVIREYLIFMVHIADRMAYPMLEQDEREQFISSLANDTARQLQRNTEEIMGPGDYKSAYFELINRRFSDYARSAFDDGMPGYSLLRQFGEKVRDIMGEDQINKWTIDQIMDKDGPDMVEKMQQSLQAVLDQPSAEDRAKSSVDLLLEE